MREDMKKQISDTFINMLEKEDIDKITVTRLIEKCHISRQTFYYHFHDIMDVLEWTFQNATQELVKESLEADDRADALQTYLSFVRQNRKKLSRLVESRKWFQIEGMLVDAASAYLEKMARGRLSELEISYDDMQVMLKFYACGMTGVLLQSLNEGALNEERMIRQLERIITGRMYPGKHE